MASAWRKREGTWGRTAGGRGAASTRVIVWGLLTAAIVATWAYVKVRPPRGRLVTTVSKVPVGPVPPERNREQILLLEIPVDVHPEAREPGVFSLEYQVEPGGPTFSYGRCRIAVKDEQALLRAWEGVPRGCDWHQPNPGATLGWSPAGTSLERPTADTAYRVEFAWLDPPGMPAEVHLWWSYVTNVRTEPVR